MTSLPQRKTRDLREAAPWAPESHPTGAPDRAIDAPPGSVVYHVESRSVVVRGRRAAFPPLVPLADSDPALRFAEDAAARLGVRLWLVGLRPKAHARDTMSSEHEHARRLKAYAKANARGIKRRIAESGDNSEGTED